MWFSKPIDIPKHMGYKKSSISGTNSCPSVFIHNPDNSTTYCPTDNPIYSNTNMSHSGVSTSRSYLSSSFHWRISPELSSLEQRIHLNHEPASICRDDFSNTNLKQEIHTKSTLSRDKSVQTMMSFLSEEVPADRNDTIMTDDELDAFLFDFEMELDKVDDISKKSQDKNILDSLRDISPPHTCHQETNSRNDADDTNNTNKNEVEFKEFDYDKFDGQIDNLPDQVFYDIALELMKQSEIAQCDNISDVGYKNDMSEL